MIRSKLHLFLTSKLGGGYLCRQLRPPIGPQYLSNRRLADSNSLVRCCGEAKISMLLPGFESSSY